MRCGRCRSIITIDEDLHTVLKEPTSHICREDFPTIRIQVLKAIKKMKDEPYNDSSATLSSIYKRNVKALINAKFKLTDIQAPTIGGLLPYPRFRGTLAKLRKAIVPPLPITVADIDFASPIYKEYSLTEEGGLFLRYDNRIFNRRIIIFMSDGGIEWLRESLSIHGDGTFASAPKLFFQFYLIFGQKNIMILPCAYCCLPDKKTDTYIEVLGIIKLTVNPLGGVYSQSFSPKVSMTDFEQSIMQSVKNFFPGIEIKGCYFHFKHALQSWLNQNGWKKIYRSSISFRIWVSILKYEF